MCARNTLSHKVSKSAAQQRPKQEQANQLDDSSITATSSKRVRFAEENQVHWISGPAPSPSTIWYNEEELSQIKVQAKALIRYAKSHGLSSKTPELRGLHMKNKKQRKAHWMMALSCVLDEQQHLSAEEIAEVYRRFTTGSVQIALRLGQEDADEALQVEL